MLIELIILCVIFYFRDHSAYFNLNLLLELSLGHPRIAFGSRNVSRINWSTGPQHQQQNVNKQQLQPQPQGLHNNRNLASLPQLFLNGTSGTQQQQQQFHQQFKY